MVSDPAARNLVRSPHTRQLSLRLPQQLSPILLPAAHELVDSVASPKTPHRGSFEKPLLSLQSLLIIIFTFRVSRSILLFQLLCSGVFSSRYIECDCARDHCSV